MSTNFKNQANYDENIFPDAQNMKFGIVVAEWNSKITNALLNGAIDTLKKCKASEENITVKYVPGCFEITTGAKYLAEFSNVDVVICIGCVIQGETKHFDYICQSVTHGITELNLKFPIPFIFSVLTVNNFQQAIERSGGKYGNKGSESAITAVRMVELKRSFVTQPG
ncbi:MAG: 6,7-dimethyl-8-ribityllumazine synthase [Bacteroidetes bacterium CG23_combo_of_CG06-09_8_20_14_all_32_9]|nr:MAG: 6,7-dimethyl-8-ribityllumazine synthase [Bacteroidetes bacterium CG23_combo_of_CG06-09_8_20_14_all_32_9]